MTFNALCRDYGYNIELNFITTHFVKHKRQQINLQKNIRTNVVKAKEKKRTQIENFQKKTRNGAKGKK